MTIKVRHCPKGGQHRYKLDGQVLDRCSKCGHLHPDMAPTGGMKRIQLKFDHCNICGHPCESARELMAHKDQHTEAEIMAACARESASRWSRV